MEDWSFLFEIGIPSTFLFALFALIGFACLWVLFIEKDLKKSRRHISFIFLLGYVVFVYSSTVYFRPGTPSDNIFWIPCSSYYVAFCGQYHLLLENALNVLLFIPIGILYCLSHEDKKPIGAILFSCVMSVSIEIIQYVGRKGVCEIDDVLHNTIGGILGYWLCNAFLEKRLLNNI